MSIKTCKNKILEDVLIIWVDSVAKNLQLTLT